MVLVGADITLPREHDHPGWRARASVEAPRMACWPPGAQAVAALSPESCRWPLGEVADDHFTFCGSARRRGSYCAHHAALAHAGRR